MLGLAVGGIVVERVGGGAYHRPLLLFSGRGAPVLSRVVDGRMVESVGVIMLFFG